jgi:DNA-binding Lrp family transcriptional regulator
VVRAYVLIEMVAGQSRNLVDTLTGISGVRDVVRVTGPYDVIVVMEGDDLDQISNFVTDSIHTLKGVVRTTTCVSLG